MHAFARRNAQKQWPAHCGIPLSQYDLALVQMAFSAVVIVAMEEYFQVSLTETEKEEWCYLWYFIGCELGILEPFNICKSWKTAMTMKDEFIALLPYFTSHLPESSINMVVASIEAFSTYTVASKECYSTFLYGLGTKRLDLQPSWTTVTPPPVAYSRRLMGMLCNESHYACLNNLMNMFIRMETHIFLYYPTFATFLIQAHSWLPNFLRF